MTATKRLEAIEKLYRQRIETHVSAITPQFVARFSGPELIAVSSLLHAVAGEAHDAARAAAGAGVLAQWRAEVTADAWRGLWLMPDVLSMVNSAIDCLVNRGEG